MRCIKCLNNSRKFRVIFGLCSVLLSVCFCLSGLLSPSASALSVTGSSSNYIFYDNNFNVLKDCGGVYTSSRCSVENYLFYFLDAQYYGTFNNIKNGDTFVITIPFYDLSSQYINGIVSIQSNWTVDDVSFYNRDNLLSLDSWFNTTSGRAQIQLPSNVCGQEGACYAYYLYQDAYTTIDLNQNFVNLAVITGHFVGNQNLGTNPTLRMQVAAQPKANDDGRYIWTIGGGLFHVSDAYTPNYPKLDEIIEAIRQIGGVTKQDVQDAVTDSIDSQKDEAQQEFQDTQDDAGSDSDSSSQQATSSGTTLLAGFQSFLGVLTGASPSNCVINADMGNMNLGSIDLCELDPPPAFQAISSIMVIGFTVPLSLALGKKMIALFRSFQT